MIAGSEIEVGAGQIMCYDRARPLHLRTDDNSSVTLAIPRDALEAVSGPLGMVHGRVLGGPAGALLRDHLVSLARLGGHGCDLDGVSGATLALAAAAITGEVRHGDPGVPHAMARAREFIDAALADDDLSADMICRTIGVSRSVLYRHFAEDGGVEKYILERRLSLARSRLSQQHPLRISELAFDLGFRSASHFSTAYRLRFGVRPSETLRGSDRSNCGLNAALRVAQWERMTDELGKAER